MIIHPSFVTNPALQAPTQFPHMVIDLNRLCDIQIVQISLLSLFIIMLRIKSEGRKQDIDSIRK